MRSECTTHYGIKTWWSESSTLEGMDGWRGITVMLPLCSGSFVAQSRLSGAVGWADFDSILATLIELACECWGLIILI